MTVTDWDKYPNFSKGEFDCTQTGENEMSIELLEKLQELRTRLNKPIIVTSGYRSPKHSIEASKPKPGYHSKGIAVDIGCNSQDAYDIVRLAFLIGFTGIRVSQKNGLPRFIHLDLRPIEERHLGSY
jgi:hypothetical protein